jgi:hypothetical protein
MNIRKIARISGVVIIGSISLCVIQGTIWTITMCFIIAIALVLAALVLAGFSR